MPLLAILPLVLPLADVARAPQPAARAPATRTLGELALAGGKLAFAPCTGEVALVSAGEGVAALVAELNGGADGSVFTDVDVRREADGRWRIERVRRAYRRGPRCAEDLGDFVWRGALHDDGWTFNASRRYVALRRPGERPLFFRYRPFEQGVDGAWRFAAQADGAAIEVALVADRCHAADGASVSDWTLTVVLDGSERTGCAWGGEPR